MLHSGFESIPGEQQSTTGRKKGDDREGECLHVWRHIHGNVYGKLLSDVTSAGDDIISSKRSESKCFILSQSI